MRFKYNVRFIHVAGNWMIIQVTDGLSRDDIYEGIMKGGTMLYFLPLENLALDRSPTLRNLIDGWASTLDSEVEMLETTGWFEHVHKHDGLEMNVGGFWIPRFKAGKFVWIPAPEVSGIVIEELSQAR